MRTMRGYCRRQARREVYKAYKSYKKGQQTQNETKVAYEDDLLGASIFFLILIIIIGLLFN